MGVRDDIYTDDDESHQMTHQAEWNDAHDHEHETNQHDHRIGDNVNIYWPIADEFYLEAVKEIYSDGENFICYDDGHEEQRHIDNETWRYVSNILIASSAQALLQLDFTEQEHLHIIF